MTTNVQGRSQVLRAAILAALATAAMSQVPVRKAHAAPDACPTVNGVVTCSGNQSQGMNNLDFSAPTTTVLRVENVTTPVTPGLLQNGVRVEERRPFGRDGDPRMQNVTINITVMENEAYKAAADDQLAARHRHHRDDDRGRSQRRCGCHERFPVRGLGQRRGRS